MEREREEGKKPHRKDIGYRVFPDINRIGRPKAVTYIPILLGHYRQLLFIQVKPKEEEKEEMVEVMPEARTVSPEVQPYVDR